MKLLRNLIKKIPAILMVIGCFFSASIIKSQITLTKALDYDGDGKVNPAVLNLNNNTWRILRSGTQGTIEVGFGISTTDSPVPGDYDGDGKGDIAVWRESNGTFYYLQSSNNSFVGVQFGQSGDEPVARDYDGDGKTDFAVVRRENGNLLWYILQSSNNSFIGFQYGISTDYPAPGDYDGDGRADTAVQRKVSGYLIFYILQSSTQTTSATQFGYATDLFAPGDYDGDGKTDIAVVRGPFGNEEQWEWIIRNSSNGVVWVMWYGRYDLRDFPVQGDYDGDGKTDIAVWRVTDSTFYIHQSRDGQTQYQLGEVGSFPIASYDTH